MHRSRRYQSSATTYTIPMPESRGRQPLQQLELIPTQLYLQFPQRAAEKPSGGIMAANEQVWTPGQK